MGWPTIYYVHWLTNVFGSYAHHKPSNSSEQSLYMAMRDIYTRA